MAGSSFRIEIPVNVKDQTTPGIDNASKKISGFEKAARRTKKQLDEMNATQWQLTLYALDRTHSTLVSARRNLVNLTGRAWNISVGILGSPLRVLSSVKNSLLSMPTLIAGVAGGLAAKKGFVDPLSMSNDFADARIGFQTMLGGQDQGDAFLSNLESFAERTPFSTAGLRDLSQRMIAFKFQAQDVIPHLEAIGDWAGMMGKGEQGIDRVSLALGQIKAKGRVQGDEMLQLTEAGINAYDYLAESMGVTTIELMKLQEKGLIPAEKAIDAIIKGLKQDFGGGMKLQEQTTRGLWNTIKETFDNKIVRRWGDGISKGINPYLKSTVNEIDDNRSAMDRFSDAVERTGEKFGRGLGNSIAWVKSRVTDLTSSDQWKDASTFGAKVNVTWDFLKGGFEDWWNQNSNIVSKTFESAGGFLGGILKGGIMAALGLIDPTGKIDENSFAGAGQKAGMSFFNSFMEQLNPKEIAKKLGETAWDVVKPTEDKSQTANVAGVAGGVAAAGLLLTGAIGLGKKIIGGPVALGKGVMSVFNRGKGGGAGVGNAPVKPGGATASNAPSTSPSTTQLKPSIPSTEKLPGESFPKGGGLTMRGISGFLKGLPKLMAGGLVGTAVSYSMEPVQKWFDDNNISVSSYKRGTFGKGGGLEESGAADKVISLNGWLESAGFFNFLDQLEELFVLPTPELWAERVKTGSFRVPMEERDDIPVHVKEEPMVVHVTVQANQQNTIQAATSANEVISIVKENGGILGNILAGKFAERITEIYANKY